ncbi:MAG: hypothetical protein P8J33_00175 [Pirellulaceae bacterium]|nr:hypothetical protein [Pirellulaceae bacterium]
MKPENAARWLTILFRLNALGLTLAAFAAFLPNLWMQQTHAFLGLGEMPKTEVVEYLARSCSMLYFIHGLVLAYVSLDMRKYWDLVGFLALLHLVMGAFVFGIDLKSGMPVYWTVVEGPSIMVFACVLCWLWKRASDVTLATEG